MKGREEAFAHCVSPPVGSLTVERCMAETIFAYDWAYRSVLWELNETRRHLVDLQYQVEPYIRVMRVPKKVPNSWPQSTPQVEAPLSHRFPHAVECGPRRGTQTILSHGVSRALDPHHSCHSQVSFGSLGVPWSLSFHLDVSGKDAHCPQTLIGGS